MAKPNYQFEKRKREIEKKKKQEEKRQKKLERKNAPEGQAEESGEGTPAGDAPETSPVPSGGQD